ncbi:MAG: N-acetyltransferase, partial [Parasporobacterium sp.]|nr:N-acetyltransferase [Parasporobacterium sp.]
MNYYITEDKTKMPIEEVMRLFKMTYWAAERPAEAILKSMENSCCFAVIDEDTGKMLGFARAVTDYSTVYY